MNFETVDVDKIHEGLWLCKITENKLNLTWITSKIKITGDIIVNKFKNYTKSYKYKLFFLINKQNIHFY